MQGLATLDYALDAAGPRPGTVAAGRLAVRRLTLTDFRCYRLERLEAEGAPVVLTGPNGAGKTNLLEALSFLVPGRGLRRARLADVARLEAGRGAKAAAAWGVAATMDTAKGAIDIGTGFEVGEPDRREKRAVRIDGDATRGQSALADHVGCLWLTPHMDRLFLEGPPVRRRFLDRLVFGSDPAHAGRVNAYDHAMRERAKLLAESGADRAWLAALEATMSAKGVAVAAARLEVASRLGLRLKEATGPFPKAAIDVTGTVETWLRQGPALLAEEKFLAALEANRGEDARQGRTTLGPHLSDLAVRHLDNGRSAETCSTGEQKALLVALVLASARMRASEIGAAPLVLLDEVVAHLDEKRRLALYDEITDLGAQAWLTGTDPALFRPLRGRAQFFAVADARVTADD
jgi:DNA replication and repair protein RecF